MAITNEPIMLNETGLMIKEALDRQNSYLAMMAEGRRSEIYNSMSQIANLVRTSSLEELATLFPIGDQIIMPWKDLDDQAHNTDETAYQVAWDIVHRDLVTLQDGSEVPGLFIQMHLCSAYGIQFSHQQAFFNCSEGLAAGTYNVTLNNAWGTKGASAGTTWQFTLTQDVPVGGRLSGFETLPDVTPNIWKVKSWATPNASDPIETVSVIEGGDGISLGSMNLSTVSEEGLNSMQRVAYGSDRWSNSAIRQYLNGSGNNWWSSKEDFDIRPDEYAKKGFLSGFNDDFLSAIKPVRVTTVLNTVEEYETDSEDTFDRFFLPSLEQMNVNPQLRGLEGNYFEYWRSRLGVSNFIAQYDNLVWDAFKIPAINMDSAQTVRLRSSIRGNAHNTWRIFSGGYITSNVASQSLRCTPVCVIC